MDKKTFFNTMASIWDELFYTDELKERLKNIVSLFHIRTGTTVLDVGSGTGGLIPCLLDAVGASGSIQAIDFSEEMVQRGKEKFKNEMRVVFQIASVEDIPFDNEYFDHVICFGAFPHFDDKDRALKEMRRVLKPDGNLIIAHTLSSEEIKNHHKNASPVMYDCLPDEPGMRTLMRNAGFHVTRIIDKPKCYICEGIKMR